MHARPANIAADGIAGRLAGFSGVILIHLLLVAFLLSGQTKFAVSPRIAREVFFTFLPAANPRQPEKPQKTTAHHHIATPQLFGHPSLPPEIYLGPLPNINGLGIRLFDCAPRNISNLTAEQREHCGDTLTMHSSPDAIPGTVKEHALEAGRWSASIASRNTPVAVPCTYLRKVIKNPITGEADTAAMVDPLCATREVLRALQR